MMATDNGSPFDRQSTTDREQQRPLPIPQQR
jgi:hypothetical protein